MNEEELTTPGLEALAADDAFLDLLAHGGRPDGDPVGAALADFRAVLDAAVPLDRPRQPRRPRRLAHRTAVIAGSLATALSVTGVAAAVSSSPGSPFYALHRTLVDLVGDGGQHSQDSGHRIDALLDQAQRRIHAAQQRGTIQPAERAAITALLDRAAGLLRAAKPGAATVDERTRLTTLRTALAAVPLAGPATVPSTPPTTAARPSPSPSDDHHRRGTTDEDNHRPGRSPSAEDRSTDRGDHHGSQGIPGGADGPRSTPSRGDDHGSGSRRRDGSGRIGGNGRSGDGHAGNSGDVHSSDISDH